MHCIFLCLQKRAAFELSNKLRLTNKKQLGVLFQLQNALKCTYEHVAVEKFSRGLYPRTPANFRSKLLQSTFGKQRASCEIQSFRASHIFVSLKYAAFHLSNKNSGHKIKNIWCSVSPPKCAKMHLRACSISKNFPRVVPRTPAPFW